MADNNEADIAKKIVRDEFYRGKYATANEKKYLALLTKNILETDFDVVHERMDRDFLSPDGLKKVHVRTLPKSHYGFPPAAWVAGSFGMNEGNEVLRLVNEENGNEGRFKLRTQGIGGDPRKMAHVSCDDDEMRADMRSIIHQTNIDYEKLLRHEIERPKESSLTAEEKECVINLVKEIRVAGFSMKHIYGGNIYTKPSYEESELSEEEIANKCGRSMDVDTFIVFDPQTFRGGYVTIKGNDGSGKPDHVIQSFKCDPEYHEDFAEFIQKATGVEKNYHIGPEKSVLDVPGLG